MTSGEHFELQHEGQFEEFRRSHEAKVEWPNTGGAQVRNECEKTRNANDRIAPKVFRPQLSTRFSTTQISRDGAARTVAESPSPLGSMILWIEFELLASEWTVGIVDKCKTIRDVEIRTWSGTGWGSHLRSTGINLPTLDKQKNLQNIEARHLSRDLLPLPSSFPTLRTHRILTTVLSSEEIQEALKLVKPTSPRVGVVPVQWWKGWQGARPLMDWTDFDVWFPRKAISLGSVSGNPISLLPTLYKLYELCMWKVLDRDQTAPDQLFGFRLGRQCLYIVSLLVQGLRKAEEWDGKYESSKHFSLSKAEILCDASPERVVPEWKAFEILVWADNIFLVTNSVAEAKRWLKKSPTSWSKKLFINQSSLENSAKWSGGVGQNPPLCWRAKKQLGGDSVDAWLLPWQHGIYGDTSQGRLSRKTLNNLRPSPRTQVAPLHTGWEEEGSWVVWLLNKTRCSLPQVRVGHSGLVAQGVGGVAWMG